MAVQPRVCRPVLKVDASILEGYNFLHAQDVAGSLKSLRAMPEAIENWYGYLSLFVALIRPGLECPEPYDEDECNALMIRLHFGAAGSVTSKLALDAVIGCHYAQARGLMRQMLETWLQMVFLRLNPEVGKRWMGGTEETPQFEPSYESVVNGIKKRLTADRDKSNLMTVEQLIKGLHKGAHPSRIHLEQLRSYDENQTAFLGGVLKPELLLDSMSTGTVATALLVHETASLYEEGNSFTTRFDALRQERTGWIEAAKTSAF